MDRVESVVVIGNPDNRRVKLFLSAAAGCGIPTHVLSWQDVLQDISIVGRVPHNAMVRIESPGEDAGVEHRLITRGAQRQQAKVCFSDEPGRIEQSGLWFAGFTDVLSELQDRLPQASWFNAPDDIACMFDKTACQTLLNEQGVPIPELIGTAHSYDEVRQLMRTTAASRVFVKLPHASSASGVVALQVQHGQVIAQTSVELVREAGEVRLYNSLKVRRFTNPTDVTALLDALGNDRLHVERWVPKAGFQGRTFDLRVVTIRGVACHTVMRTSTNPLTNLHLGNARGPMDELQAVIPGVHWDSAMRSCERAANCFPNSLYTGIDLLFIPGFRRHAVIEVNAFGDLLPNVLHQGRTTYEAEIAAMYSPT